MGTTGLVPITGMTVVEGKLTGWSIAMNATKAMLVDAGKQVAKIAYLKVNGSNNTILAKFLENMTGEGTDFNWGSVVGAGVTSIAGDLLNGYVFGSKGYLAEDTYSKGFKGTLEKIASTTTSDITTTMLTSPLGTFADDFLDKDGLSKNFSVYVQNVFTDVRKEGMKSIQKSFFSISKPFIIKSLKNTANFINQLHIIIEEYRKYTIRNRQNLSGE